MKTRTSNYRGYRFPRETISHSVWLYHLSSLSFRAKWELLILLHKHRNADAAKRFFRKLLKEQ